jgi:GNAT superfamily N-acetyltransferase
MDEPMAGPMDGAPGRPLRVARHGDVGTFLADAGTWLEAREAEHNLMLGISSTLRFAPVVYPRPPYLAVVRDGSRIVAAAMRTPPWPLILSEVDDPRAVPAIAADIDDALAGERLSGVVGPPAMARAFADGWVAAHGGAWEVGLDERVFRLSRVIPPSRPAPGAMRKASTSIPTDRALVTRWVIDFAREALPPDDQARLAESVDSWLELTGRTVYLWEDGSGQPVSLTGVSGATPNGIRIGPVYTPSEFRGRGYASSLVAAVSQAQLDAGRQFCFLYTDLANPTSNRIYQAIGYEPVTDALRLAFRP